MERSNLYHYRCHCRWQGVNGSDFTLENTDTVDDIFNGIEVGIERTTLSVGSNTILPTDFIPFFKQNEFKAKINLNANSKANIKLYSVIGSLIFSEDIVSKTGQTIFSKDMAVPAGIYIAVLNSDGKSVSQKIIKK
ncbi:T9SS type A sorting domain-containing protein [Flavobacterium myungsuense]|uniref:T9SS type A sorting domain-containing protein n=1 Tax=Flavobacterium myungsuense TaxID=651823 RepID=UPI00364094E1